MSDLSEYFAAQAQWRWQKAEEYPDDLRNAQSARALESLAEYVAPDDEGHHEAGAVVGVLEAHLFEQFILGGEEVKRAVSRYGFGYEVTAAHHIDFLDELSALCVQDAYTLAAAGGGDDPTDALFPFEAAAAKDGIYLPHSYWEHRGGQTEQELEEAVDSYRVEFEEEMDS